MIESISEKIIHWIERFLEKNWELKTTLFALACTLLFSSPSFSKLQAIRKSTIFSVIENQIESPFLQQNHSPISHFSKRTFRLFMPMLGKMTHVGVFGLLYIQYVLGILFFYVSAKFAFQYSNDKTSSFFFVIGLTGIYLGKSFFLDYWAFFDGVAFFFLLLSMYFRNPFLIFTCLTFAFWTDERALVAGFGVIVFHLFLSNKVSNGNNILKIARTQVFSIIAALFLYVVTRLYMSEQLGLSIGNEGVGIMWALKNYVKYMPLAIFMFFESYWILIFFAVLYLNYKTHRSLKIVGVSFLFVLFVQSVVALSVGDMVRSGSYVFVLCFASFAIINTLETNKMIVKKLTLFLSILTFLIPTYSNFGGRMIWMKPDFFILF